MSLHDKLTDAERIEQAQRREALAAQLEQHLSRPGRDHAAEKPARPVADVALSIADVMPEMIASMERRLAKWAEYCETMRQPFADAPDDKACQHHPTVRRPKLFEETCETSRRAGIFTAVYAPCGECKGEAARDRQRAFWRKRGVPERVVEATLSSFVVDTEEKAVARGDVQDWIKRNGVFLLLRGSTGTGKGHLAAGCLKAQQNGLWITHADMLADLRASYTLHTTSGLIDSWREAEMFVLDEFGVSPGGGDEEAMLYQVLADRYDKRRPTIITTNLDREGFAKAIGYRLLDRIGEDCTVVPCVWDSWRARK